MKYVFAGLQPAGPDRGLARVGFGLVIVGAVATNAGAATRLWAKRKRVRRSSLGVTDFGFSEEPPL